MEFNVDLINALAKRGWKIIVWVLPINIILSTYFLVQIVVAKGLFSVNTLSKIDHNISSLLGFLIQNITISFIVILIFYIVKGDSGDKIKKMRSKFYNYAKTRVFNLFIYRYNPPSDLDNDISDLVRYHALYERDNIKHTINVKSLIYNDLIEIDSLYIIYKINDTQRVLFSIWNTGKKIAIAIAFKKDELQLFKSEDESTIFENIKQRYRSILNISDAKDISIQIREKYYWFDIVYEVSEELLINNMEQEDISRKIAHIITVGLPVAMSLMGWKAK